MDESMEPKPQTLLERLVERTGKPYVPPRRGTDRWRLLQAFRGIAVAPRQPRQARPLAPTASTLRAGRQRRSRPVRVAGAAKAPASPDGEPPPSPTTYLDESEALSPAEMRFIDFLVTQAVKACFPS